MKKVISAFLVFALIFWALPANAASFSKPTQSNNSIISPQYIQICEVDNGLYMDDGYLHVFGATLGYSDADSCKVTAYLQKKSGSSWSNYKTWSVTSPSSHKDFAILDILYSASSGEYRLLTTHSVTVDNVTEYEYMESDEVTVS